MSGHWVAYSDFEALAKRFTELENQVKALQSAQTHIPFVNADPGTQYGNVWGFNDNRVRIMKPDGTIREIITTAPGSSSSGTMVPTPPAQPVTHQQTWAAAWSQTYRGNGAQRSETLLHVGSSGDSYNGAQTALIGWPYASIATALAGAEVTAVEIYLYTTHCYWNAGSTINFAGQANTSAPGSLTGVNTGVLSQAHVKGTDEGGEPDAQRWKRVSTAFGAGLRDGTMRGVALVPTSSNVSFYAILGGVGSGVPAPQIRITYVV